MRFTDAELVMYVDGVLDEERGRMLREASQHDSEIAANLAALDASRLPYKAAYEQRSLPQIPQALRTQIADLVSVANSSEELSGQLLPSQKEQSGKSASGDRWMSWPQGLATAACVGLCIVFGYWLGSAAPSSSPIASVSQQSVNGQLDSQMSWVERVADYQSLYVHNTVKNIIPNQLVATELLDGIEQRTGMQTAIPDLSGEGYQFVRAQELGYMEEPLVQLIYSKPGAKPLALCYTPSKDASESEFTLASFHGLSTASWTSSGQRFVLVGSEGEAGLRKLYSNVSNVF